MVVAEPQGCPVLCSRGTAADLTEVKDLIVSAFLSGEDGFQLGLICAPSFCISPQEYRKILRTLRCKNCEKVLVSLG